MNSLFQLTGSFRKSPSKQLECEKQQYNIEYTHLVHRLTLLFPTSFPFKWRDFGRIKLLLKFCSGTYTSLNPVGQPRFRPTGFFWAGNRNGCSYLWQCSNFNSQKWSCFPEELNKWRFFHWLSFYIVSSQYIFDRYLDTFFFFSLTSIFF